MVELWKQFLQLRRVVGLSDKNLDLPTMLFQWTIKQQLKNFIQRTPNYIILVLKLTDSLLACDKLISCKTLV